MLTDAAEKKPPWLKTPDTQRLLTTLAMKSEARNTGPLAVVFRKLLCLPSHSNGTTSLTPLSNVLRNSVAMWVEMFPGSSINSSQLWLNHEAPFWG